MDSQIKWNKQDILKLEKAVNDFNNKLNRLQKEERKLYLPENLNLKDVKENIVTRKELNRKVESLRRFMQEGSESIYETEAGEKITKWERAELGRGSRIAQNRLKKELASLNVPRKGEQFSRVQMGSPRAKVLEKQIENLTIKELETSRGYDFKVAKARIEGQGVSDLTMKRAIVWRENHMREMEKYQNFENYEKLEALMKRYSNPISYFNKFTDIDDKLSDLQYQSDQVLSQEEFNSFLNQLGIKTEDIQSTPLQIAEAENKAFDIQAKKIQEKGKL